MLNRFRDVYYNVYYSDGHTNVINTCSSQLSLREINSCDDEFLRLSESRVPCLAHTMHTESDMRSRGNLVDTCSRIAFNDIFCTRNTPALEIAPKCSPPSLVPHTLTLPPFESILAHYVPVHSCSVSL